MTHNRQAERTLTLKRNNSDGALTERHGDLYDYCVDDPVTLNDPTGLIPVAPAYIIQVLSPILKVMGGKLLKAGIGRAALSRAKPGQRFMPVRIWIKLPLAQCMLKNSSARPQGHLGQLCSELQKLG